MEETNLDYKSFTLLNVFSGEDFYFKYPNGDELYSVIALYLANDVTGELKITDGESFKLVIDEFRRRRCINTKKLN